MQRTHGKRMNRIAVFAMLALGIGLTVISAIYLSSFLAVLGVGIVFWGAILFYITPARHVPLTLLSASAAVNATNTEKILTELNLAEKGRYLPPKYLKNHESSLVFIPERLYQRLPRISETTEERLRFRNQAGLFLTPPGVGLSKLFEQALGVSFAKIDLACMQQNFPKLLTEGMELVETADIQIQNDRVTLEITGSILAGICQETRKLPRTHEAVGCLLSSAVACALAKATGKAVTIEKETQTPDNKTTRIEFQILGE
jgi:hypothetical protein